MLVVFPEGMRFAVFLASDAKYTISIIYEFL